MFGLIIRPLRSLFRALGRTPIVSREQQALSDTRKTLLSYRSARENSKAEVSKYTERVTRLREAKVVEEARMPEKRSFDWARFDSNTLLTAIKDDLYEAEKKLHEELANFESNDAMVGMFEKREERLVLSLQARTGQTEAQAAKVQASVEYDPASGRIDLLTPERRVEPADGPAVRGPRSAASGRQTPSAMGGLVTS